MEKQLTKQTFIGLFSPDVNTSHSAYTLELTNSILERCITGGEDLHAHTQTSLKWMYATNLWKLLRIFVYTQEDSKS